MDRATWWWGTPILLQSIFVLPFTHFDPPTFPNGGAMVPIPYRRPLQIAAINA
jgi:hypothetical protein